MADNQIAALSIPLTSETTLGSGSPTPIPSIITSAASQYSQGPASTTAVGSYTDDNITIFPQDLIKSDFTRDYVLQLPFYKYVRPYVGVNPSTISLGRIILPLPKELIDNQASGYSPTPSGPVLSTALDAIAKDANQGFTLNNIINNALSFGTAVGINVGANLSDKLGQILGNPNLTALGLQAAGFSLNPFLTVLFDAPSFKAHNFSWTFVPNNQTESDTLKYMINKLKYHQLPATASYTAGTILMYPDMLKPSITPSGHVYSFKFCVLTGVVANYAPGNTPSFNKSTAPTAINLTIQLMEIEYWLKDDFINTIDPNLLINQTTVDTGFSL